ncbi:MAG: nucleotide exchange factor GrpE [Desulfobacteraceae bacterium 4572_123]|nr:MAG: nucleotide exchange factor GrpE [Desulfobacteraceae bacterium 4572_123]
MSPKKNIKSNAESAVKESEENTVVEDSGVNKPVEATEQTEDPKEMLEIALKKADKNYDSFLRVSAEFDNYKKRTAREMNDFRKFANESLVKDLLPVVDNLERALESSDGNGKSDGIAAGIELTLKEILKILDRFSVKPIDALGKNFDPCFHQAVLQEETCDHEENMVLKELQKGYMLHDRLIRPSMVVVSKAQAAECES